VATMICCSSRLSRLEQNTRISPSLGSHLFIPPSQTPSLSNILSLSLSLSLSSSLFLTQTISGLHKCIVLLFPLATKNEMKTMHCGFPFPSAQPTCSFEGSPNRKLAQRRVLHSFCTPTQPCTATSCRHENVPGQVFANKRPWPLLLTASFPADYFCPLVR